MINYLAKKLKVRKSILYLLFVIILLSAYNFIIKKEIAHINEMQREITKLEYQLSLIEKKVKGLDADKLVEMEHRTEEFKREYDLGLESQLVLLDITKYAEEAQLDIIGFQARDKLDLKDFKHRVYTLAFKGSYEQFLHWLRLMEKMPYYINIGDLYAGKYLITKENQSFLKPQEELIFRVSINNIAVDGNLNWKEIDPEKFRPNPFEPGIGKR